MSSLLSFRSILICQIFLINEGPPWTLSTQLIYPSTVSGHIPSSGRVFVPNSRVISPAPRVWAWTVLARSTHPHKGFVPLLSIFTGAEVDLGDS